MNFLTASTTKIQETTNYTDWTEIDDLSISPPERNVQFVAIFNAPAPFAVGDDHPGAQFQIRFYTKSRKGFDVLGAGEITSSTNDNGRKPVTIVATHSYDDQLPPTLKVVWRCIRANNRAYLGGEDNTLADTSVPIATLTVFVDVKQ